MNKQEHLNRAKYLFEKGRFQQLVSRDFNRFELIDATIKIHYDTRILNPYFDKQNSQVVYATTNTKNNILYLIGFSQSDYFFDPQSKFEWADSHVYGFKDRNDD